MTTAADALYVMDEGALDMASLTAPQHNLADIGGLGDLTAKRTSSSLESRSINAIDERRFGDGFVRPAYEDFCFSNLPGLFEKLILGSTSKSSFPKEVCDKLGGYDHVIFAFVDAFGWESFERFRDTSRFLRAVERDGLILKSTSQFPSTTAAHVSTILSGLPVYEHGVCGWDYYEPRVGRMIKPLVYSFSEDTHPGTLQKAGLPPEQILPRGNFLSNLRARDVHVELHGPAAYYPSPFNLRYSPIHSICGYSSLREGVLGIAESLMAKPGRSYHTLYADAYDSACHEFGVGAPQSDAIATEILRSLGSFLNHSFPLRSLLVVSADHGHMATPAHQKIAINTLVPGLEDLLKLDARGEPIRFSGGKRYLFLHPKDAYRDALVQELRARLNGAATVMTLPELSAAGLLGPGPLKDVFAERLGSVGVLPHAGYSVYWHEPPMFDDRGVSGHGGVSHQEMETPVLFLPLC